MMRHADRGDLPAQGSNRGGVMQLKFILAAAAGLILAMASSVQAAEIKLMSSLE